MGWCQAIVLVAYFGILQCDLSQSTNCNCNNKPTIMQFRIPSMDMPMNCGYYSRLPYPYTIGNQKPSNNQKKCSSPKCNIIFQPAAVKMSIPSATKSGFTNVIIDTRGHPNATFEEYRPKPPQINVNVSVVVGESNKSLSSNASEPAVSAKTNVSSTKDADGNHVKSVSSADDSRSNVYVTVTLNQLDKGGSGVAKDDIIVKSDSLAKDGEGNIAESTSTTGTDEEDEAKPKTKVDPKSVKKDPAATAKNPAAKIPKVEKPVTKEPEAKKTDAEKSEAKKPETDKPEVKKPVAEEPEGKKPETKKPETEEPVAEKPEAKEAEDEKPVAKAAEGAEPAVGSPDAKKPATKDPEAEDAAADDAEP